MLHWQVIAILWVALWQLHSEYGFACKLLFDFFEASSARCLRFHGAAASARDLGASGRVHAPGVAGGRVALFSFVVTVGGATWGVEARGVFAATFFNDFSIAGPLFFQSLVHAKSSQPRGGSAVDVALLAGSRAGALDFFTGVSVHAPAVTSGTVVLGRGEQTIIVAHRNVVSYESGWAQSLGTFDVADGAFWFTRAEGAATVDWFTSVGNDAPASADGSVALGGLEETVLGALRDIFAGHWASSVLSCLCARCDIFGALYGDRENDQERTSQSQKLHFVAAVCFCGVRSVYRCICDAGSSVLNVLR